MFVYQPDGSLRLYSGGYTYYKEKEAEEASTLPSAEKPLREKADPDESREVPKTAPAKRRFSFKEQREYAEIDGVIASKEGELKVVQLQMAEQVSDYGRLNELSQEESRLSAELEQLMERWTYLEGIAEEQE